MSGLLLSLPKEKLMNETLNFCYQCGECTSICPVSDSGFKPHDFIAKLAMGLANEAYAWRCLTCRTCMEVCPQGVEIPEIVRELRGENVPVAHKGIFQSLYRLDAENAPLINREEWLKNNTKEGKYSEEGDTLFFIGCLPVWDLYFEDLGFDGGEIFDSALILLNKAGIVPRVINDELCCGHDARWAGDNETFERLKELNENKFKDLGIKRIVTVCPECAKTLKQDYNLDIEINHISELLGDLSFKKMDKPLTYQDSCRMGRYLRLFDEPREILTKIGDLAEMERNKEYALCCGVSAWVSCDPFSKRIRYDRLDEAERTAKGGYLVTPCQKCQIHFKCAINEGTKDYDLEVIDLVSLARRQME